MTVPRLFVDRTLSTLLQSGTFIDVTGRSFQLSIARLRTPSTCRLYRPCLCTCFIKPLHEMNKFMLSKAFDYTLVGLTTCADGDLCSCRLCRPNACRQPSFNPVEPKAREAESNACCNARSHGSSCAARRIQSCTNSTNTSRLEQDQT